MKRRGKRVEKRLTNENPERILRQAGEGEKEAASTPASKPTASGEQTPQANGDKSQQPARLYPDLPQQPNFVPPFNGVGPHNFPAISHHHGQTPFVPFGLPMPTSRLNADQQPAPFGRVLPPARPLTPAERLQSQSFANGLGRRLLSIVGIEPSPSASNETSTTNRGENQQPNSGALDEAMRALQNTTVLQQLNKGVQSIYGGLSKMYNSTVREQLNLLQDRFTAETQNITNPWHQRVVQQVPQFFQQMANKVGQAQEQLNKVWSDVTQAAQGNSSLLNRSAQGAGGPSLFPNFGNSADFFDNIGHSLSFGGPQSAAQMMPPQSGQQQSPTKDLSEQLREFWFAQVQPQIGMVRSQMARVWRDLTASGALIPESLARARAGFAPQNSSSSSAVNLVDDILKEVDMSGGSEYTLIEPKDGGNVKQQQGESSESGTPGVSLSPQMQNRLISMQRELNQLWMGLTNSLQGAINNVKNTVNPARAQFGPGLNAAASTSNAQTDPSINEIDSKVRDLSRLQRDADMVYETVQQQQRENQQRETLGDRFKTFFNSINVDLSTVNQLPDRIGQSFNRFGSVMGDLWNQLPERWDNLMQNMRPQQRQQEQDQIKANMKLSTTSAPRTTDVVGA